jgi:hypothetical protein
VRGESPGLLPDFRQRISATERRPGDDIGFRRQRHNGFTGNTRSDNNSNTYN